MSNSEELSDNNLLCEPLRDLKSVLEWVPPENSWAELVVKKSDRTSFCYRGPNSPCKLPDDPILRCAAPKTLLCHDMKGGYLEDRFVYGSNKHDEYRFIHWSSTDIFVYFSHHFVTIPPLGWINSGHKHGVSVLGTLITEWKDGEALWKEVLDDPVKTLDLCEKLTKIATFYGFDGYLLNVENEIEPGKINALIDFVKILKSLLSSSNPQSLVYWYDSVIVPTGQIKYQNKLNRYNIHFFDACDGIFLNYNWNKEDLMLSMMNGQGRNHDIFVGVDVFGRGCYGGGGFNTRLAVEMVNMHGMSVALFAPGWVHETLPKNESFVNRDYLFWSSIRPLLYIKGPANLPFQTSFCQGYGERRYQQGIVVSDVPWFDLNKQQYQPSDLIGSNKRIHCISHYSDNAFNGGSCLHIKKCFEQNQDCKPVIHRLFICEFKLLYESKLRVSYVISSVNPEVQPQLILVLLLENSAGSHSRKILCTENEMKLWSQSEDFILPKFVSHLHENRLSTWEQRNFELNLVNTTIVGIGCALGYNASSILLGEISIEERQYNFQ